MNYLPKRRRGLAVARLRNIYLAPTVLESERAIKVPGDANGKKYPKAVETIAQNRDYLLAFYGYPGGHLVAHKDKQSYRVHFWVS
jgi:transposase-like protein